MWMADLFALDQLAGSRPDPASHPPAMTSLEVLEQSHHFQNRLNLCSLVQHLAMENAPITSLLIMIQGWGLMPF